MSSEPTGNTIALIAAVSVIGTVLLIVVIVGVSCWCRKVSRNKTRKRSRTRLYMVPDGGVSPFSSVNGAPSWGSSYFLTTDYDNNGADIGKFRTNPLVENPYYRQPLNPGVSLVEVQRNDFSNDGEYSNAPHLSQSTQSLSYESQSYYHSLYNKLVDTIHTHTGRPLYLCKREDYYGQLTDHFDIIGKSRTGDWLVRPKPNVPNRTKRPSKKAKPPKPSNSQNSKNGAHNERSNGFIARPAGASGVITTPFGAAERTHYFGGSNINRTASNNFEPQFASLPRANKPYGVSNAHGNVVNRQSSMNSVDRERARQQQSIDQQLYTQVMQRNVLNEGAAYPANVPTRQYHTWDPNPNRRPISTVIEESPRPTAKVATATKKTELPEGQHRERSGSASTMKSLGTGITDQFKFLEQYDTEEERF